MLMIRDYRGRTATRTVEEARLASARGIHNDSHWLVQEVAILRGIGSHGLRIDCYWEYAAGFVKSRWHSSCESM